MKKSAIVLLSGGLDSTTVLAVMLATYKIPASEILAISFEYGQRHDWELASASSIAQHYDVQHLILSMPRGIFDGSSSTLIDHTIPNPHKTYRELELEEGVSPTYVPNRNAIFITMAVAKALVIEAGEVFLGTHAEDARGWAYPDCSPEFVGAMAAATYIGTYHKVRLVVPFEWDMKKDIVRKGLNVAAPYHLTRTCYEAGLDSCGVCPSCVERLEAFKLNLARDPIVYVPGSLA